MSLQGQVRLAEGVFNTFDSSKKKVAKSAATPGCVRILSPALQAEFLSPDLTEEQAVLLMQRFVGATAAGTHAADGWPNTAYGTSKIGVNALTRVHARAIAEICPNAPGVLVNSCCPGWCRTDMAGDRAPRSAEEGATTSIYLALLPAGSSVHGAFFAEERPIGW